MREILEVSHPMRQRCPGPWFAVAALALLALGLGGCRAPGECGNDLDCPQGLSCMHWQKGTPEEITSCEQTCPVEDDYCADGRVCGCADSPAKKRCFNDAGKLVGVCGQV